jgi:RimJ/RimL family protein N-acetyltransferase
MFKGKPDKNGKAEIGYGTHEEFRDKGYMGEAVEAVCRWAFQTGIVKYIVAETAKDNHASFSLLKKNGFIKYDENDGFFYWMKTRNA